MKPVAERLLKSFTEIASDGPLNDWIFLVEKELTADGLMDDEMMDLISHAKKVSRSKSDNVILNIVAKLKTL